MSQNLWQEYKDFVFRNLIGSSKETTRNLGNWQDTLFATVILYMFPMSLLALIPSIIIEYKLTHIDVIALDLVTMGLMTILVLVPKISVFQRKIVFVAIVATFATVLILYFDYMIVGSIYLFGLTIFISFQFPWIYAYLSVFFNLLIFIFLVVKIDGAAHFSPIPLSPEKLTLSFSNLLFVNLIVVIAIRQTLSNLGRSMLKESALNKALKKELEVVDLLNTKLKESEAHYKALFFSSPLPKFIYEQETMNILQVNNAAVNTYGYPENELLAMNFKDLIIADNAQDTHHDTITEIHKKCPVPQVTKMLKKEGTHCFIELNSENVFFNNTPSVLVITADVTERIKHVEAIKTQNDKLQEIAYMQSHVIRSPLAKIMSLSDLISREYQQFNEDPLFVHLDRSVKEIDVVICDITRHIENVVAENTFTPPV